MLMMLSPSPLRAQTAVLLGALCLMGSASAQRIRAGTPTNDRVDYVASDGASWAIMNEEMSPVLGDHIPKLYDDFMTTCNEAVSKKRPGRNCQADEASRFHMNLVQPSSVRNYTVEGFKKIKAPKEMFSLIKNFYDQNKHKAEVEWTNINTYHNMWEAPPTIVRIGSRKHGGGAELQTQIWDMARNVLEEWTGQFLSPVSLYGVRLYHNNSILAPHVDRMPLVTSAIINVDQDADEPWPLEVYGHDGRAHNVTMEPGDMVLYESHSVIHGRPFPFRGRFYANIFCHFEPIGSLTEDDDYLAVAGDLPPYIVPGSPWASEWRRSNPNGWDKLDMDARTAAQVGDLHALKRIAKSNPETLHEPDRAGWQALHEAVRSGHFETVKFLIDNGADINQKTRQNWTPLSIAHTNLGQDHMLSQYLTDLGAELGPEL